MTPGVRGEGKRKGERVGLVGLDWREKGEEGRWRNARPEERTIERGRELVRAGAFPLANSRARDGWMDGEKERKTDREKEKEREGERELGKRKDARPGARWDVNFLAVRSFVR